MVLFMNGKKTKIGIRMFRQSPETMEEWKENPQLSMYFRANLWTSLIWGHVGAVMGPGMMEYPTHHQDRSREMCNKFGIHREQSQHQNEDRKLVLPYYPKRSGYKPFIQSSNLGWDCWSNYPPVNWHFDLEFTHQKLVDNFPSEIIRV